MSRAGIEQLLYLMDEAFENNPFHSFLANLKSVREEDWHWLPANGVRSIFHLVQHVGGAKYVYESNAFGDRSMRWDRAGSIPIVEPETPQAEVIDWLREGHRRCARAFRPSRTTASCSGLVWRHGAWRRTPVGWLTP